MPMVSCWDKDAIVDGLVRIGLDNTMAKAVAGHLRDTVITTRCHVSILPSGEHVQRAARIAAAVESDYEAGCATAEALRAAQAVYGGACSAGLTIEWRPQKNG